MTEQKKQTIEIVNNPTKLVAFVGNAQSGKGTSCSYFAGLVWHLSGLVDKFDVDPEGKLRIYDLKGYTFPKGKRLDVLDWNNDEEINHILDLCSPHPMNLIQKISYGDRLKEVIHLMFGIPRELLWGSDKDKQEETMYTANNFIDLIGAARFPFKDKKGNDKMTVREVMQFFGTEVGRRIFANLWVDRTVETIYEIIHQWRPVMIVVDDVRFDTEFESIKKMNGVTIALMRNPRSSAGTKHGSEQAHKLFEQCDYVLDNRNLGIVEQCTALFPIFQKIHHG